MLNLISLLSFLLFLILLIVKCSQVAIHNGLREDYICPVCLISDSSKDVTSHNF